MGDRPSGGAGGTAGVGGAARAADADRAPRVSVLMTCHDAAATIEESVRSVIAQSFTDWELVLVDNGSTDYSVEIVERLGEARIRIDRLGRDIGRTAALNHGLTRCRGEYVAVLDADDVADPSRLARQVAVLDERPEVAAVGSGYRDIDALGRAIGTTYLPADAASMRHRMAHNEPLVHSSVTMRATIVREIGGYPTKYRYAQDFALWLALLATHHIIAIPEPLVSIRRSSGTLSRSPRGAWNVAWDGVRLYARAQRLPGLRVVDRMRGVRTIAWFAALLAWRTLERAVRRRSGRGVRRESGRGTGSGAD